MEISWCSASAVRFIGTQRPSATIDQDVSTSSATAARVRCSVSTISTSRDVERPVVAAGPAELGVEQRPRHRPRLGVAELPRPGRPVRLAGRAGPAGLPLALPAADPVGDVAQHGLPERAQRLRREQQRTVRGPLEQALALQLALQLGQRARVGRGLLAEHLGERVEVDVLHPRARVALGELLGQVVELAELLHRPGGLAHPHRVLAAEPALAVPVLAGTQALQLGVELLQRLREPGVPERLLGQLHQLGPLLGGHRVHHPLGGRGPGREQVDQFLGVLRVLREVVPVLAHELTELLGRVLPCRVRSRAGR